MINSYSFKGSGFINLVLVFLSKPISSTDPSTVLASTTGGDISFTGILNNLIKVDGSVDDTGLDKNTSTKIINPEPLKEYEFIKQ